MSTEMPHLKAPPGACDCHMHVYDAITPTVPTAVVKTPTWANPAAYRQIQQRLGIERAIVVQPTSYGTDNSCTLNAIADLGLANTRGVAVVDTSVSDAELDRLHRGGIRGVRFQMLPGGVLPWEALEPIAARIAGLGWHAQVQMDGRLFAEREALLAGLPCRVVIDHVGKFLEPVSLDHPGFLSLSRLLDRGTIWLKLSAPYEVSRVGPPYADVGAIAKALAKSHPERMLWASNWPHIGTPQPPDEAAMLDLLLDWVPSEADRHRALVDNPAEVYDF